MLAYSFMLPTSQGLRNPADQQPLYTSVHHSSQSVIKHKQCEAQLSKLHHIDSVRGKECVCLLNGTIVIQAKALVCCHLKASSTWKPQTVFLCSQVNYCFYIVQTSLSHNRRLIKTIGWFYAFPNMFQRIACSALFLRLVIINRSEIISTTWNSKPMDCYVGREAVLHL